MGQNAGEINDVDLREDFYHIQVKLSEIIIEDVNTKRGGLTQRQRVASEGDRRMPRYAG